MVRPKLTSSVKDMGWNSQAAIFKSLGFGKEVKAGFVYGNPLGRPTRKTLNKDKVPAASVSEVASIAYAHEYGIPGKLPKRPFMSGAFDPIEESLARSSKKAIKEILKGASMDNFLRDVGKRMSLRIKKEINSGKYQKLSKSTERRKGNSRILIETAQMLNTVGSKVVPISKYHLGVD